MLEAIKRNTLNLILLASVLAAVIYNLVQLNPLFSAGFFNDDFFHLEQGPLLKHDPFIIFSFTYGIYWRPIGYGMSGILYLLFGLNTVPYHIIGYLIHLLAAGAVFLLGRRMFDKFTGTIAAIIYIVAPVSISSVGFVTNTIQDELATFFMLMTLYFLFKREGVGESKVYWLPALMFLLAAMCKESWLGLYPAILFLDWFNHPKSTFKARVVRLSPFIALLLLVPIHILVVNVGKIISITEFHMGTTFTFSNFLCGLTQFFYPSDPASESVIFNYIALAVTLVFLAAPFLLYPGKRKYLLTVFISILVLTVLVTITVVNYGLRGWVHFYYNAAFGSILIAATFYGIFNLLRNGVLTRILVYLAVGGMVFLQSYFFAGLEGLLLEKIRTLETSLSSFQALVRGFPPATHIYMIGGPPVNLARDALIPPDSRYTQIFILHDAAQQRSNDDYLAGNPAYIREQLRDRIDQPGIRVLQMVRGGRIEDITPQVRDFVKYGKPFPLYKGRI